MPSTSTLPSELLRTQPAIPSMCASRSTNHRKPTPCTRPRTTNRRASAGFSDDMIFRSSRGVEASTRSISELTRNLETLKSWELGSGQIDSLGSIYLDLLALIDKRRHLYHQAGFGFRRLGHVRGRRAFQAGLGLDHGQLNSLWQLDSHRLAVEKLYLDRQIWR